MINFNLDKHKMKMFGMGAGARTGCRYTAYSTGRVSHHSRNPVGGFRDGDKTDQGK